MLRRTESIALGWIGLLLAAFAGCANPATPESSSADSGASSGGNSLGGATNGGAAPVSGGASALGGSTSGGNTPLGGSSSGGSSGRGGSAQGGSAQGGVSSAGSSAKGGSAGSGALGGSGGKGGAGGSAGKGGASATAGASGAASGSGGASANGGASASGGSSGTGGASVLFTDDFETGNASRWTPDVENSETGSVGNWAVLSVAGSNAYEEQTSYSDNSFSLAGSTAWTDQKLVAKVLFATGNTSGSVFLVVRYTDRKNYYFVQVTAAGELKLYSELKGSKKQLGTTYKTGGAFATNTWMSVGISAIGSNITAYLALPPATIPSAVIVATDANLTAGEIALVAVDGVAAFDDVVVTNQ